jgi:DNA-binding NtrC family response regulator
VPPIEDSATIENPMTVARTVVIPRYTFEIVGGDADRGRRFVFEPTEHQRALVGRGEASAFRLADPQVSLRHAALDVVDNCLRWSDLDSRNGTFVDGVRIGTAFLSGGETVRLGQTVLKLDLEVSTTRVAIPQVTRFGRVIGASPEMCGLYTAAERFSLEDEPVLIEGEMGAGKELLAEALHEVGPRAGGPFLVVDCAALAPALLETMLFGVEAGALPEVTTSRLGAFENARGGTLLLDEIGDLDARTQAGVLRAIEDGTILRVGGRTPVRVDVRIIATTRRDLERDVEAGHFQRSLFSNLAVRRLELPPLRRRGSDIELLASHFWTALGGEGEVPDDFVRRAKEYGWPGNVQELVNAVARRRASGAALATQSTTSEGGVDIIGAVIHDEASFAEARRRVLDAFESRYLAWLLAKHGGNVSRAAASAGIARRYFYAIRSRTAGR